MSMDLRLGSSSALQRRDNSSSLLRTSSRPAAAIGANAGMCTAAKLGRPASDPPATHSLRSAFGTLLGPQGVHAALAPPGDTVLLVQRLQTPLSRPWPPAQPAGQDRGRTPLGAWGTPHMAERRLWAAVHCRGLRQCASRGQQHRCHCTRKESVQHAGQGQNARVDAGHSDLYPRSGLCSRLCPATSHTASHHVSLLTGNTSCPGGIVHRVDGAHSAV